ncbi:SGNH/GDSL hydrolase family protein [Metabacillus indicus]|uniref:SGNH/GDSL hydrolase family protein n=1 Tax=Metabacillus indicus TaxID=246786 RepID=UPI00055884FC|nr:GDSL-type esterase/lipase family protein [Metabacillus indicus]
MKIALIGDSLTEGRPGVSFFNILEEKFPNISFDNLGKPGESVKSLYTRLLKTKLDRDYDLIFLWIGVNDVYSKMLSVQAQPAAKNHNEFKAYYEKILDLILSSSKKVVAVTPALVGENANNTPNHEIKELNLLIQSITRDQVNVSFLDIHSVFLTHLSKVNSSDYISTKVMRVMVDVLFYKKPSRIDRLSKKRGLHLTLDGIHLNSAGAEIVAEIYASEITRMTYKNQDAIQS